MSLNAFKKVTSSAKISPLRLCAEHKWFHIFLLKSFIEITIIGNSC